MKKFYLLLSILLTSAPAAMSQQSLPVQFFPYGYYVDNSFLDENRAVWNFADSIDQQNVFINDLITKIEKHFNFNKSGDITGIGGLNYYLMYKVYDAFAETSHHMGMEYNTPAYQDTASALFTKYIDSLTAGYENKLNKDSMWVAEIPFSVFLNHDEKNKLLKLLNIQDIYLLSSDMTVKNFNCADISYGSHPITVGNYFHFTSDSTPAQNLVFSAPANAIIDAFPPNKITTDTLQKEYKTLLDSLNMYYGGYFNINQAQKFTFTAPESHLQVSSVYNENPFFNFWFSVLFYNNKPQCFMSGHPLAILQINNKRFWIFEIDTPEIGLYGFQFYTEENDSLKLYSESYLFSI